MARDQFERTLGQGISWWNLMPGRCTGRMRQRDQVERVASMDDMKFAAYYIFQLCAVFELSDRQAADGNHKARLQNLNLVIHPQHTVANLVRRRDTVAATRIFAGKTAADGGEIDF